jgi:hypothetical protein
LVPEPGQLPFGILTRRRLNLFHALQDRHVPFEMSANFAQPDHLRGSRSDLTDRANFLDHASFKHRFDALIDSLVKFFAIAKYKHAICFSRAR